MEYSVGYSHQLQVTHCVVNSPPSKKHEIFDLIARSDFINPSRLSIWKLGLTYFFDGEFYGSLVVLLPQIEDSLRRLFAVYNHQWGSLVSAESERVMVTLETLLAGNIEDLSQVNEDTTSVIMMENKLYAVLGNNLVHWLYDYLFWEEGNKTRDRISHGIADPKTVTAEIADQFLAIVVALCVKFDKADPAYSDWIRQCTKAANEYSPKFHPKSCLIRELQNCLASVHTVEIAGKSYPHGEEMNNQDFSEMKQIMDHMKQHLKQKYSIDTILDQCGSYSVPFDPDCSRNEVTVVKFLRQVCAKCVSIINMILSKHNSLKALCESRDASSAQRQLFATVVQNWSWVSLIPKFYLLASEITFHAACDTQSSCSTDCPTFAQVLYESICGVEGCFSTYYNITKAVQIVSCFCLSKNQKCYPTLSSFEFKKHYLKFGAQMKALGFQHPLLSRNDSGEDSVKSPEARKTKQNESALPLYYLALKYSHQS